MKKKIKANNKNLLLNKEKKSFDDQTKIRISKGFIPDLRNLKKINWFYNNVWREPKFLEIQWGKTFDKIIKESKFLNNKVLEIGCGTGFLTLELARKGLNACGIDVSEYSIKIANQYKKKNLNKKNFGKLNYICDDFDNFNFEDNKFDTIIFYRSLHHFPNIKNIFEKINRISKKNTKLIICEPIRDNFNMNSALFAMIIRTLLPTWISHQKKIPANIDNKILKKSLNNIINEYKYEDNKGNSVQSPLDNSISSEKEILKHVGRFFRVKEFTTHDAISDKIIGGIRGRDRFILAEYIKNLDEFLIENNILKGTTIQIVAQKK